MSNPTPQPEKVTHLKLVTRPEEVRLDVVGLLEEYLELARAGQIVSIGIVAIKPTENVCYGFSSVRNKVTMLGATDMLMNLIREDIRTSCSTGLDESDDESQ